MNVGARSGGKPPDSRTHEGRIEVGPAEAAIVETFVVPRYLSFFGEAALESLISGDEAQVVHLDCLTGYPDRGIALSLPGAHIYGVDASPHAVELARAKAFTMPEMVFDYRSWEGLPVPLPTAAFSHGLDLHLPAQPDGRARLLGELARLIAPDGQVIVAMPLRGSFLELLDLLREFAVRYESEEVNHALDQLAGMRPTGDGLAHEVEAAGFGLADVSTRIVSLSFQSGRDFFEDPVARFMVLPEFRRQLGPLDVPRLFGYVQGAIDKYWSESPFELSLIVGCATGRRRS